MINTNESYEDIVFNLNWSQTRSKDDIALYVGATLLGDYEWIMREFNNEFSIRCLLACICCFPLSLFKILCFIPKQLMKPQPTYNGLKYNINGTVNTLNKPEDTSIYLKEQLENCVKDTYCTNTTIKSQRAETLNSLRKYLYQNDLKLQGKILKHTEHRVSEDDLLKSIEDETFMPKLSTTQITFGNEINEMISIVLPDMITLKKKIACKDTYVTFKDDDYGFLEETLKQLYNEPIRVTFD